MTETSELFVSRNKSGSGASILMIARRLLRLQRNCGTLDADLLTFFLSKLAPLLCGAHDALVPRVRQSSCKRHGHQRRLRIEVSDRLNSRKWGQPLSRVFGIAPFRSLTSGLALH